MIAIGHYGISLPLSCKNVPNLVVVLAIFFNTSLFAGPFAKYLFCGPAISSDPKVEEPVPQEPFIPEVVKNLKPGSTLQLVLFTGNLETPLPGIPPEEVHYVEFPNALEKAIFASKSSEVFFIKALLSLKPSISIKGVATVVRFQSGIYYINCPLEESDEVLERAREIMEPGLTFLNSKTLEALLAAEKKSAPPTPSITENKKHLPKVEGYQIEYPSSSKYYLV